MATKTEIDAAAAVIAASPAFAKYRDTTSLFTGLAKDILEAAEAERIKAMDALFGPDVIDEGSYFVDRSRE